MMLCNSWAHMGSPGMLTRRRQHLCPWLCWSPKDTSAISIALCFDWVSKLFFFFTKISVSLQLFHPITCDKFKASPPPISLRAFSSLKGLVSLLQGFYCVPFWFPLVAAHRVLSNGLVWKDKCLECWHIPPQHMTSSFVGYKILSLGNLLWEHWCHNHQ